jgi:hypothetical protein
MPQETLIHFSSSLKDEEVTEQPQQQQQNCVTTILRVGSRSALFRPTSSGHFASSPTSSGSYPSKTISW